MPTKAELLAQAEALGFEVSDRLTTSDLEMLISTTQVSVSEYDAAPLNLPVIEAYSDSGRTRIVIEFDVDTAAGRFIVERDKRVMHSFGIMKEGPVY